MRDSEQLATLQGAFGPFRPQIQATVPIWLAVLLKKRGKCSVQPPEWMSVGETFLHLLQKL